MPIMHTMPFVKFPQCQLCIQCRLCTSHNANFAHNAISLVTQCQICIQCRLCRPYNAKCVNNANCASYTMPIMHTMPFVNTMPLWMDTQCQLCTQFQMCSIFGIGCCIFGIGLLHIWHWLIVNYHGIFYSPGSRYGGIIMPQYSLQVFCIHLLACYQDESQNKYQVYLKNGLETARMDLRLQGSPCELQAFHHPHVPGWHQTLNWKQYLYIFGQNC